MKRLVVFAFLPVFFFSCIPDSEVADADTVVSDTVEEEEELIDTFSVKRPVPLTAEEREELENDTADIRQLAQDAQVVIRQGEPEKSDKIFTSTVVTNPDVPPSFPGGTAAMEAYITKKKIYPLVAFQHDVKGTVTVKFVVESDGSIGGITLVRGIGYGCDESAMDLVRGMPKWVPGKKGGANVRCAVTLPVSFGD
jgi:periplasmic protein TonB